MLHLEDEVEPLETMEKNYGRLPIDRNVDIGKRMPFEIDGDGTRDRAAPIDSHVSRSACRFHNANRE
jgi:hypothetical protein